MAVAPPLGRDLRERTAGPLRRALGIPYSWPTALAWPLRYALPAPAPRRAGFAALPPESAPVAGQCPIATIAFLGDFMPTPPDLELDVEAGIRKAVGEADLVLVNCESPLAAVSNVRGTRFQYEGSGFARHIAALGLRPERLLVSVANNHAEDRGPQALLETARQIEDMGGRVIGLRDGDSAEPMATAETGARIGVCAWTQWRNRPGRASAPRPWTTADVAGNDWRATKDDRGLDILIGFPHWGAEFCHTPRPSTRRLAATLLLKGFDVLFGHHPHVVQGLERIGDSLVLYSGGSAIPNDGCARRWPGRLSLVLILKVYAAGSLRLGYRVLPCVYERSGRAARLRALAMPETAQSRERGRFDAIFPSGRMGPNAP